MGQQTKYFADGKAFVEELQLYDDEEESRARSEAGDEGRPLLNPPADPEAGTSSSPSPAVNRSDDSPRQEETLDSPENPSIPAGEVPVADFGPLRILMAILKDDADELQGLIDSGCAITFSFRAIGDQVFGEQTWKLWKSPGIELIMNHILDLDWTPLHLASSRSQLRCAQLLLSKAPYQLILDENKRSALDVAGSLTNFTKVESKRNFMEVIRLLLPIVSFGQNDDMTNPLHLSVTMDIPAAFVLLHEVEPYLVGCDSSGQTPLHLCIHKKSVDLLKVFDNIKRDTTISSKAVNARNKNGHTVLHEAIIQGWVAGVWFALKMGADIEIKDNDGESPLHLAATSGHLDILKSIVNLITKTTLIDLENASGETALIKAVINGHPECVKTLLKHSPFGVTKVMTGGMNIFHIAAKTGNIDVMRLLISSYELVPEKTSADTKDAIVALSENGYASLHYAVLGNHVALVKVLIVYLRRLYKKLSYITYRRHFIVSNTSPEGEPVVFERQPPMHIAAAHNFAKIAKMLLDCDKTLVHKKNSRNETPLHTAINYSSRDVIIVLLREGARLYDTIGSTDLNSTAIDLLMHTVEKPTQFLEELFDSCITTHRWSQTNSDCKVIVDYRILAPGASEFWHMEVIAALLKTGNRHGQKELLVHPLLESFLHLKWKALLPFFMIIASFQVFFVLSLTIFCYSVFFFQDTKDTRPAVLDLLAWGIITYISIVMVILQEYICMNIWSKGYYLHLETWVKIGSTGLAAVLPAAVAFTAVDAEWPRHVATIALLLAWIQLMILLSRFPNWGYYVHMFGEVAWNVCKILLTFSFLFIGFSLSFMIQFRSQDPFGGIMSSLMKTLVMMTSEFDYNSLNAAKESKPRNGTSDIGIEPEYAFQSLIMFRALFAMFIVLTAIVLMNLTTGVAVDDIAKLKLHGKARRLDKQAQILITLDNLVFSRMLNKLIPEKLMKKIKRDRDFDKEITLNLGREKIKYDEKLPAKLRNAIFDKAKEKKKKNDNESTQETFKNLLKKMHNAFSSRASIRKSSSETPDIDAMLDHDNIINKFEGWYDETIKLRTTATVADQEVLKDV